MKKYILLISVFFVLAFSGLSCKKFLDYRPDDMLTLEMIFSDRIRTEDWLSGVYSGIPNPMWGYFKDQGFSIMGDDMTIPAAWQQFGWSSPYAYAMGNWSPISFWGPYYWVELPKRIRQGLIFIENVKPLHDKDMEQAYVDLMKGEVRFLMAYYYWLMVEIYGPIPFTPGVIYPTDASLETLSVAQSPVDTVVNYLDKEFLAVAEILPPVWNPTYLNLKLEQNDFNAWGRATSIMALAMRARMLMHFASPLLNGNPDYANVVRKTDGTKLFPANYDPAKWKRAADACKLLIDKAHAAGYKLYYEYNEDGSIDPFMSYYNAFLKKWNEGNKEIIFGRPGELGDLNSWQNHHLPIGIGGNGGIGVTQELVDAFFMKNGLPITDPNSGYVEKGFSATEEVRKTKWRGAEGPDRKMGRVTQEGTYNMYCNREPRFYASVIYNEAWLGVANRRANFFLRGSDGGPSFDAPQNGYNVRKRISLDVNPRGAHPYQPGILHRLAEFYLDYAEALNEFDPGNREILTHVNKVRERAGLPGLSVMSQDKMREAIIQERRVEFNCEGLRIHDLRRWKLCEQYLGNKMYGMNFFGTQKSDDENDPEAFYKRTFSVQRNFFKRQYLWPVPQAQMDINPNLTQMPGY